MEVRTFSNAGRPDVGQRPRREGSRPLLPQHARHCPVLESGSALGFMVYAPLEPNEAVHIGYDGEGKYTCTFFLAGAGGTWDKVFTVAFQHAVGGLGAIRESVEFRAPMITDQNAVNMAKAFLMPENLGTPPGAISLRGATNFQTPAGLGHGLHADLQHDRAARGADADRARGNRLVRARHRVPLRVAAGRGHEPGPHVADWPGDVRAARRGHARGRHRGRTRGLPDVGIGVLPGEGRTQDHDRLRPAGTARTTCARAADSATRRWRAPASLRPARPTTTGRTPAPGGRGTARGFSPGSPREVPPDAGEARARPGAPVRVPGRNRRKYH